MGDDLEGRLGRYSHRARPRGHSQVLAGAHGRALTLRRRRAGVIAAVVVLIATVGAIALLNRGDDSEPTTVVASDSSTSSSLGTATSGPSTSASSTIVESPTLPTTPTPGSSQPGLLILKSDGTIARSTSGATADLRPIPLKDWVASSSDVTLTATSDGSGYFDRTSAAQPCSATVFRVDPATGIQTPLVDGAVPSVSIDGRWLAYVTAPPFKYSTDSPCPEQQLVVRELATGAEKRWPTGYGPGKYASGQWICHIAWLDDGASLAFEACGEVSSTVHVLDTADAGQALNKLPNIGPPPTGGTGPSWRLVSTRQNGTIDVIEWCCVDHHVPSRLLNVDPSTGSSTDTAIEFPDDVAIVSVSVDGPGEQLLLVSTNGVAYRRAASSGLEPLPAGVVAAAWIPTPRK